MKTFEECSKDFGINNWFDVQMFDYWIMLQKVGEHWKSELKKDYPQLSDEAFEIILSKSHDNMNESFDDIADYFKELVEFIEEVRPHLQ